MATDPAAFLRSLGDEAVVAIEARDGRISRLGAVSQLQAVGVAFVMVGLLAAQEGETILGEIAARFDAVGARLEGVAGGELTVGSEVASFWARRSRGADDLWAVPVRVAVPQLELTLGAAAVFIDSLILTPAGLRGRGRAEARFAGEAHGGLITRWSDLTAVDNRGRSYQLKSGGGVTHIERRGGAARWWRWTGNWTSAPVMPADTAWLDVYAEGSEETARIVFSELLTVPTGPADRPWPTPAETYLAGLAPAALATDPGASFGVGLNNREATLVVAAVADALLAVGALPPHTTLLRSLPARASTPPWRRDGEQRGSHRAIGQQAAPGAPKPDVSVGATVPLEDCCAVVEYLSVVDEAVTLHLYISPDMRGEYWPVNVPCVTVDATDEHGAHYTTIAATYWSGGARGEGHGDRLVWPPVPADVKRLRVRISTFWEAGWADLPLPGR
jgi:hypothetical protein